MGMKEPNSMNTSPCKNNFREMNRDVRANATETGNKSVI